MTIFDFLNNVLGFSGRYNFILYIVAAILLLVLLDGLITFLFSSVSSIFKR